VAKPVTQIKINKRGAAELLKSPEVRALLRQRAEAVAARARSIAPVDTGRYRDDIGVRDDTTDRAVVRVGSSAPHAHLVEARDGVMVRALGAEGG